MLRKTTAAVVLAGALALGTASATSLGTFDDISFAASSADLDVCTVTTSAELLDLLPAIPDVGSAVPADNSGLDLTDSTNVLPADGGTLLLDSLDLTALAAALPATCTGDLADLVLLSDSAVVETVTGIDLSGSLTDVGVDDIVDIASITEVRLVVRSEG